MQKINARNITLAIIFVLILIVIALFIGRFTYSYLAPDIGEDLTTQGVTTASGDTLIFSKGNNLSLSATTDNFNATSGNLTDTTNPSVRLISSGKTNNASATYYAGIRINANTYQYTTPEKTAEIILTVKDENGTIVTTSSDSLDYVTVNGVSGFDITEKSGVFNIVSEHPINTNSSTLGTTHTWTFTLTFINLETDQSLNENGILEIEVILQKEEIVTLAVYWNDGFSGSTYTFPNTPATTYTSPTQLSTQYYIKTTATEHQACLYYNDSEFCLKANYWDTDGSTTKTKLQNEMASALGVDASELSCDSNSGSAHCYVSGFSCDAHSNGNVDCGDDNGGCEVDSDGIAYCGQ